MDFALLFPLVIILMLLIGLKRYPKSVNKKQAANIAKLSANCTVLLPHNKVAEAHLLRREDEYSVVLTEEFGKMTVPNHCLRFIGSLREINVKNSK